MWVCGLPSVHNVPPSFSQLQQLVFSGSCSCGNSHSHISSRRLKASVNEYFNLKLYVILILYVYSVWVAVWPVWRYYTFLILPTLFMGFVSAVSLLNI